MSNPATRVRDIASVSRDQVQVGMSDCLTSRLSAIGADIEAVWPVLGKEDIFHNVHKLEAGRIRLSGQLKNGGDMCLRNHEAVAERDRVFVLDRKGVMVFGYESSVPFAEGAVFIGIHHPSQL